MSDDQINYVSIHEKVFIASAIVFNLLVSAVYVYTKFDNMELVKIIGYPFVFLILPFGYTLYRFVKNNSERIVIISNALVIVYLLLELLLDKILVIPFRDILWLHILYIMVFYAAEFSILRISFNIDRRMGLVVLFTFVLLLGCLIYLYLG